MTVFLGKHNNSMTTGESDIQNLVEHARLVLHGGFIDRVLGDHFDKRIPHKELPKVDCPILDTTTIDETHDDQMFDIIRKLVEQPYVIDFDKLIIELKSLGAVVRKWGEA